MPCVGCQLNVQTFLKLVLLHFQGKKMIKKAKRIFPSLAEIVLLEDSKHVPNASNFKKIEELILDNSE